VADVVRVAIADDAVLLREGIGQILRSGGIEVVASVGSAEELLALTEVDDSLDAVVLDIKMPPTHTDEGLRALEELRRRGSTVGVLLLSMYTTATYAIRAMSVGSGTGYLLKDRVADADTLVRAVRTVASGGSVVDSEVVAALVAGRVSGDALGSLSERERDVLTLMAEGRSNSAIAERHVVSERAVEKHVGNIFGKLGLPPSDSDHRRVLAVLAFLDER
jgi:DNA-binding NarL/FixJ family response regulator